MTKSGYARLVPHHDEEAVTWWFYRDFDDGFAYARGGRLRSARQARKAIDAAWNASIAEHKRWLNRRTHELGKNGELVPIPLVDTFSWGHAQ